jgi:hypothetical protein
MTTLTDMTKAQLLDLAKENEITGRHDMSKADLVDALAEFVDEGDEDEGDEVNVDLASKDQLVDLKRRKPSRRPRDGNGKVIRKETNLSGNQPFQPKPYALGHFKVDAAYEAAVKAAPGQVQLILKAMRKEGIVGEENAMRGGEIVELALAKGYVRTKIDPNALWAYYAVILQALGVVHYPCDE